MTTIVNRKRKSAPFTAEQQRLVEDAAERLGRAGKEFGTADLWHYFSPAQVEMSFNGMKRTTFGQKVKAMAVWEDDSIIDIRTNEDGSAKLDTRNGNYFFINRRKTPKTQDQINKLWCPKRMQSRRKKRVPRETPPQVVPESKDFFSDREVWLSAQRTFLSQDETLSNSQKIIKLGQEMADYGRRLQKKLDANPRM